MPVLPVCPLEPLRVQFSAPRPKRPRLSPVDPPGRHRQRIPDRAILEHAIAAVVNGSGYEWIASPGCSVATIRHRRKEWAVAGQSEQVHAVAPRPYDRMIGLELDELAVGLGYGSIVRDSLNAPEQAGLGGRRPCGGYQAVKLTEADRSHALVASGLSRSEFLWGASS